MLVFTINIKVLGLFKCIMIYILNYYSSSKQLFFIFVASSLFVDIALPDKCYYNSYMEFYK